MLTTICRIIGGVLPAAIIMLSALALTVLMDILING